MLPHVVSRMILTGPGEGRGERLWSSQDPGGIPSLLAVSTVPTGLILTGRVKQTHPSSDRGAGGRGHGGGQEEDRRQLPRSVCQLLLPLRGWGRAGRSGNLNLIPPASHLHRFSSKEHGDSRSNLRLSETLTLSDLGRGVCFWAERVLDGRTPVEKVASPSVTGPWARDASSTSEPCAPRVPLQACNSHSLVGPAALVLSAF